MKKILVIDREGTNRAIMKLLLESMGHQVTEAMTCAEGIGKFQKIEFDLVITDLRTSDDMSANIKNGFDVIQEVRKQKKAHVVLAASVLSVTDQSLCFVFPPDAFLQKPFDQGYFKAVVATTLVD